jgi:molybdopterin-containing oxidoreductase family membrane subunit
MRFLSLKLRLACWIIVLLIPIALGLYAWNIQLKQGLIVTGMRNIVIWGLYISSFIYFVGLAAGGLIMIAAVYIFGAEKYKPITRIGEVLAAICVFLAMLFIIPDLGRPDRILNLILSPNPSSMFIADFIVLTSYFIFTIIFGWLTMKEKVGMRGTLALSAIGLPLAISIHSVTAWIFGLIKARPMWHTALLAPIFLSSAIVSAIGLLIFTTILTTKFTNIKIPSNVVSDLGRILSITIPIDIFLLFCEILTTSYAAEPRHIEPLSWILLGPYAPAFWTEVTLGIIAFLLMVNPRVRSSTIALTISSIFVMVGIWLKRFLILIPGLSLSPIGEIGVYVPTWIEWSIIVGLYAFGALLYTLSTQLLPLKVEEKNI